MVLEARQARAGDGAPLDRRGAQTLLVVTEEPDAGEVLVRLLVHAGFRADCAVDEAEAASLLSQVGADAVVLHTSATADRPAALDVLGALRAGSSALAAVPVLAVVGQAAHGEAATALGAVRVLHQPVHVDDLAAEIDAATRP